jgi:hypothetical protein
MKLPYDLLYLTLMMESFGAVCARASGIASLCRYTARWI